MADYSGNQKLCATCAYWTGTRNLNFSATWVTNCASEGRCAVNRRVIKTTIANLCACSNWKKWEVLK